MEFYLPNKPGYALIDGSLTFISPKSFEVSGDSLTLLVSDADNKVITLTGSQLEKLDFYNSPREFETANPMTKKDFRLEDIILRSIIDDRRNMKGKVVITSEDGSPREVPAMSLHVVGLYVGGKWKTGTVEDAYSNQQEWCKYNDYTEVNSEGIKVEHQSYKTLMAFSDEQQEAVNALNEAFKKCEKLGMSFMIDTDICGIRVYNTKNVDSFHTCPEYDLDDEDGKCDVIDGLYKTVNPNMYYYNCDYSVLVRKKNDN